MQSSAREYGARLLSIVVEDIIDAYAVAHQRSNVVWAVATLKGAGHITTIDMAMVWAMCHGCIHVMVFVYAFLTGKPAESHEMSSLMWAAATFDFNNAG